RFFMPVAGERRGEAIGDRLLPPALQSRWAAVSMTFARRKPANARNAATNTAPRIALARRRSVLARMEIIRGLFAIGDTLLVCSPPWRSRPPSGPRREG